MSLLEIKNEKNLLYFVCLHVLLAMVFVSACGDNGKQNNEEEKYDVVVKIRNSLGDEWIFDLDTDELSCEYEYTGEEISFYPYKYNLPAHPLWSEKWIDFYVYGQDTIDMGCLYWDPDGNQDRDPERNKNNKVLEKGRYLFTFNTNFVSQMFIYRRFQLFVIVD